MTKTEKGIEELVKAIAKKLNMTEDEVWHAPIIVLEGKLKEKGIEDLNTFKKGDFL